jgi:hypothetical protein
MIAFFSMSFRQIALAVVSGKWNLLKTVMEAVREGAQKNSMSEL